MDNFIEELKERCKSNAIRRDITLKDVKAVYILWNDENVSRRKLLEELHRDGNTLRKLDKFIKNYIEERGYDFAEINDGILQKITDEYNYNREK